jgi:hypothetical protein
MPKRRKAVQDAIVQMRATERALGPEFMTRLRMLARDFDLESLMPLPGSPVDIHAASDMDARFEPVDQKKNLTIVMKFLQMNPDNKNIQSQIRMFLADQKTIQ